MKGIGKLDAFLPLQNCFQGGDGNNRFKHPPAQYPYFNGQTALLLVCHQDPLYFLSFLRSN